MKILRMVIIAMIIVIASTVNVYAVEISSNALTYTISAKTSVKGGTYYVYLLSDGATIKCFGSMSTQTPNAKYGNTYNRKYISKAVSANTLDTRTGLADSVRFIYSIDKNGVFTGKVTIIGPYSNLTGVSFVVRDSASHYFAINGTDDISSYVEEVLNPVEETEEDDENGSTEEVTRIRDTINDVTKTKEEKELPDCVLKRLLGYISS